MAKERLSMRKAKEVLRMKWELKRSHREIVCALGVSMGAVSGAITRAAAAGLDWAAASMLTEEALEERLYTYKTQPSSERSSTLPDFCEIHAERQKRGVTLQLLHLEYRERHPDGYGYTQFCEYYRRWLKTRGLTMRQEHVAGDKLFVDYSGKKPHIVDPQTGSEIEVELFVAVLGASNYTYCEATATQRVVDFVASHVRTFEFIGGVTSALVPDQLKSGVIRACRYEPDIQRTYEDMAEHYGTAVIPARPRKPKDKAKVEVAVQVVQRWILARLRKQTFFSLDELNAHIRVLLDELNNRQMRRYGVSRRERFEQIERPALRPLPATPYTFAIWSKGRVNKDYHIEVDEHFYSVPHRLVGQKLEARATAHTVEVLRRGVRVAVHVRSAVRGEKTTTTDHMPTAHRKHLEWTPERIATWAAEIGPGTSALVDAILRERPHPQQGYRSCLGILRLQKRYGPKRLERASQRALLAGARSCRHIESILKHGLDRLEPAAPADKVEPKTHENVRGAAYYH